MNDFMLRRVKSFHIYANDTQSRKHNKGNLIDLISERFSGIDYRRKSETKLRGVIVRNVGNIDKFSNKLRLTRKTIMAGITLRQLIRGHQKGGKFRKQVTKKIALELLRTKCNENFMYSVSSTSSSLKLGNLKKY